MAKAQGARDSLTDVVLCKSKGNSKSYMLLVVNLHFETPPAPSDHDLRTSILGKIRALMSPSNRHICNTNFLYAGQQHYGD